MSFIKSVLTSVILIAFLVTARANDKPTAATSDNLVVLISLDGLAAHYLDDPKADMPNMRALAKAGARAESMTAVAPSVTWPNHTTLVTGVAPAKHGVVGNNYYDRAKKKQITLIYDPTLDKDEIVKVPAIYDVAKVSGMKTAAINWPASRNAKTLDWTIPEVRDKDLYVKYTTPSFLDFCQKNGISMLDEVFQGTMRDTGLKSDEADTRVFNLLLKEKRPQLAIVHLANVDHTEHEFGPNSAEAYASIKAADDEVGAIWKTMQKEYPGKATLFVVSDHGFSRTTNIIYVNVILRQAGLVEVKDKKVTGGSVKFVSQGGAAMLYVTDEKNKKAVLAKIAETFKSVDSISKIIMPNELNKYGVANPKDDPNAPDVLMFAKDGNTFGDTAAGDLPFNQKPERFGSHGHDPALPNLHATFIACGAGIKPGTKLGEISNLSVAPTMAKLLKLSLPTADGKPLTEILTP